MPIRFVIYAVALLMGLGGSPLLAQRDQPWTFDVDAALRGQAIDTRLGQPFSMTTAETELIGVLARVQQVEPLAVWIDPRVDPRQPVAASDRTTPLANFLDDLAAQSNSRRVRCGDTLLFVPAGKNDRLVSLARLREQQRLAGNAIAIERADIVWSEPQTPTQLLERIAEQLPFSVRFETPPKLDYDLWRPGQWLDVAPSEALAAVLVPMNRGFEWTAERAVRITPLAERYEYEDDYPTSAAKIVDASLSDRLKRSGRRLRFTGTAAEHDAIAAAIDRAKRPAGADGIDWSRQRFTTTLRARLGELLQLIEDRGMPIAFDRAALAAAGIDLQQRIEVELKDATIGQFAAAIADAAGLESTGDASGATIAVPVSP